jgi:hypothetical protein
MFGEDVLRCIPTEKEIVLGGSDQLSDDRELDATEVLRLVDDDGPVPRGDFIDVSGDAVTTPM